MKVIAARFCFCSEQRLHELGAKREDMKLSLKARKSLAQSGPKGDVREGERKKRNK